MTNITPKGKNTLMIFGVAVLFIVGLFVYPRIRLYIGNTPPEEFNEQALVEVVEFSSKIPYETDHFRIFYDNYYSEIVIVPLVEIDGDENPIDEYERVWPQYEQYANEAIAWMKAEGADLAAYDISFWGEDFWPSGRAIQY